MDLPETHVLGSIKEAGKMPKVRNRGGRFARIPKGAKLVDRTRYGNPYPLDDPDDDEKRAEAIRLHRDWVLTSDEPIMFTFKSGGTRTFDPR